jgi:stage II sporulation protein M
MSFLLRFVIVIFLFCLGLVLGLLFPDTMVFSPFAQTDVFENLSEFISLLPQWAVFLVILLKNISAVLFGFLLSPLFLVVPVLTLILNGWIIGAVAQQVIAEHSIRYLLTGLLPHGIIEIPALFIGETAALGFGFIIMQAVISNAHRERLVSDLKPNLKYLVVALILLVPAAVIETLVTPALLEKI